MQSNYEGTFEIQFNLIEHKLQLFTSKEACLSFHLHAGLSIADFYKSLFSLLESLNIYVAIVQKP